MMEVVFVKIFEANNANKEINGGLMILEDISLTISKGEKIAITGSNGSGKSSLLKLFGITNFMNTSLKHCSKGTKQKAGIIQALIKNPDLLLLDEPLTGLDEQSKVELLNELSSFHPEKTIIFTAHESLLIGRLANRVMTIENGKIISDSTKKQEQLKYITAKLPSIEIMKEIPSINYIVKEYDLIEIIVPATDSDNILAELLQKGCSIIELTEKR